MQIQNSTYLSEKDEGVGVGLLIVVGFDDRVEGRRGRRRMKPKARDIEAKRWHRRKQHS